MTWFTENPTPLLILGIVTLLGLGILLVKTNNLKLLMPMLLTAIVMFSALLVDWLVVTDREAIEGLLHHLASAIERDDTPTVIAALDPKNPQLRRTVQQTLSTVKVRNAKLPSIAVTINRLTPQPTAVANVLARGDVSERHSGNFPGQAVRVEVRLWQAENGSWLITGYEIAPPLGGNR